MGHFYPVSKKEQLGVARVKPGTVKNGPNELVELQLQTRSTHGKRCMDVLISNCHYLLAD